MTSSMLRVREDLEQHPESTIPAIMDRTGLSRSTVRYALLNLPTKEEPFWPRRYTLVEPNGQVAATPLTPIEAGPRWNEKREEIGRAIAGLDLSTATQPEALRILEILAASLLGMIAVLRTVGDVPEWRQEIGL